MKSLLCLLNIYSLSIFQIFKKLTSQVQEEWSFMWKSEMKSISVINDLNLYLLLFLLLLLQCLINQLSENDKQRGIVMEIFLVMH